MTNQPAFPFTDSASPREHSGMTLLDYFAAKAMQAEITGMASRRETLFYEECAALAYEMAEAMMAERTKRGL